MPHENIKISGSDIEKIMPKIIDDSLIIKATISAMFSSVVGTLLVLLYLSLGKANAPGIEVSSFIFTYVLMSTASIIGTMVGSLLIGLPLLMIAQRFCPDAYIKGSLFIVCSTLFIWLVVLAWPVTRIFEAHYSDILLLSPYAFCSAIALTYQVYWI